MGLFTTVIEPGDPEEYGLQFKTEWGFDACHTYSVGDTVGSEPDGVYEAVGRRAGDWFELWSVVIQDRRIVSCTRYPDGTPSLKRPHYVQLPRE